MSYWTAAVALSWGLLLIMAARANDLLESGQGVGNLVLLTPELL